MYDADIYTLIEHLIHLHIDEPNYQVHLVSSLIY